MIEFIMCWSDLRDRTVSSLNVLWLWMWHEKTKDNFPPPPAKTQWRHNKNLKILLYCLFDWFTLYKLKIIVGFGLWDRPLNVGNGIPIPVVSNLGPADLSGRGCYWLTGPRTTVVGPKRRAQIGPDKLGPLWSREHNGPKAHIGP